MSDPTRPHTLARDLERGLAGSYVAARYAQMRCDGGIGLCRLPPERAPRLLVPPKPFAHPLDLAPLRLWTTLHYCERHKPELKLGELLTAKVKADIEAAAKRRWPQEYRPDFDRARIEWRLVTTPEYRAFLRKIELAQGIAVSRQGVPVL